MKEIYEVIWAEIEENDLQRIVPCIGTVFPEPCRFSEKLPNLPHDSIRLQCEAGLSQKSTPKGVLQYREQIVSPWRIIHRISGHKVFVLSVLASCQNIEDILLKRLLNM